MMGEAMVPLRSSAAFIHLMTQFKNPLLGIFGGAIFTSIIQSSSASVGILQALAGSGIIPFSSAVYVLFGQNIGTCITAFLASIGTSKNAKRTTIIHLSFNLIGTILFTIAVGCVPVTDWIAGITPNNTVAQIANMHTTFNLVTTILLLPFGGLLARMSEFILSEKEEVCTEKQVKSLNLKIATQKIGSSAICIEQVKKETERMLVMARINVQDSFEAFLNRDSSMIETVEAREENIDFLNKEISNYISKVIAYELDERESHILSSYFKIIGNIERIGDHAMNICGYSEMLCRQEVEFSQGAVDELLRMQAICKELLSGIMNFNVD